MRVVIAFLISMNNFAVQGLYDTQESYEPTPFWWVLPM